MPRCLLVLLFLVLAPFARATTWDEPWHGEVLRGSDTLGLFEIVALDHEAARLKTIRTLAGEGTPAEIEVDAHAYWRLQFTSLFRDESGKIHDEFAPDLPEGHRAYLLLKRHGRRWQLATPTAGVAGILDDGTVAATYRISVEKTIQDAKAYEHVQACLFRASHGDRCPRDSLATYLVDPLSEPAAGLGPEATPGEVQRFFRQHVALESAYLLDASLPLALLEPFLAHAFFHTQVSAVRALKASHDPGRDDRLVTFIADPSREANARVTAVLMAKEIANSALTSRIKALKVVDENEAGLPMGIMDPRIGTSFPDSVQNAIESL
jgi:hypothetical protein